MILHLCLVFPIDTGPSHVRQLDLGFLGSAGGHAAFDDVLLAGPGRLDHLVMSAAAPVNESVAEINRRVVDDLCLLVREQFLASAMGRNKTFGHNGFPSRTKKFFISPASPVSLNLSPKCPAQ